MRNYILLIMAKRLEILCKLKKNLYPLVTILGDSIFYGNRVICIKIKLLELKIEG